MVCSFQLLQPTNFSRQDFYKEFLVVLDYYGINTKRISLLEQRRIKLYDSEQKKWLEKLWNKHYTLMYDWDLHKMSRHPRETLQWSQIKAMYSYYLELDVRLNLNRKVASSINDSPLRQRARSYRLILKELAKSLRSQHLHKELMVEDEHYEISPKDINRFILMYANAYGINLASTALSNSLKLAAITFSHNFSLRVPTFEKYRKVYNQEVFTRLAPFDLDGQLERALLKSNLVQSTFVKFDGKRIQSRKLIQIIKSLRFKLLKILLPEGTAYQTKDLISNLQKMTLPLRALLDHREELSKQWYKIHDSTEMKKTEERLIELLSQPIEEK